MATFLSNISKGSTIPILQYLLERFKLVGIVGDPFPTELYGERELTKMGLVGIYSKTRIEDMPLNARKIIGEPSRNATGKLLHGSDVPEGVTELEVLIKDIREAPKTFGSPAILDIEPVCDGCTSWAVNKQNLQTIVDLVMAENPKADLDKLNLSGRRIILEVYKANNPKTGKLVPSLAVTRLLGMGEAWKPARKK